MVTKTGHHQRRAAAGFEMMPTLSRAKLRPGEPAVPCGFQLRLGLVERRRMAVGAHVSTLAEYAVE